MDSKEQIRVGAMLTRAWRSPPQQPRGLITETRNVELMARGSVGLACPYQLLLSGPERQAAAEGKP